MNSTLVANLVAYCAQVACIVAAGSLLPFLLRIDAPSVRYLYWRVLLAVCLVLPFVQEWRTVTSPSVAIVTSAVMDVSRAGGRAATSASSFAAVDWLGVAALVVACGVVVRLAWVAISLLRLHRLRSAGRPAAPCTEHADLQRALGTHADIRYVAGISQPVTFGVRWPVVLLPEATLDQPADIQRAVLCHELIHVERRDWAWVLVEEIVRAGLWFHPAVWWLVSLVQAAREEVVDGQAVRITGGRRRYIEALMVFADAAPVVPAAAFSRRRHLFRRILLLSRETPVSATRLAVSCAVMAGVLAAGSWYSIDAFPLSQLPPPVSAAVTVPGLPEPQKTPSVTSEFAPAPAGVVGGVVSPPPPPPPPPPGPGGLASRTKALPPAPDPRAHAVREQTEELRSSLPVNAATAATNEESQASPGISSPAEPVVERLETPRALTPLRVGVNLSAPRKVKDVTPVYPPIASAARVSGIVIVETTIGADGRVVDARVMRSIPLLDDATLEAVRQWEFTPTLLNGVPVPIVMSVTVNFTLQN